MTIQDRGGREFTVTPDTGRREITIRTDDNGASPRSFTFTPANAVGLAAALTEAVVDLMREQDR
jgi:6-phosphogluconolactonase (cycloisomerase 2 family)